MALIEVLGNTLLAMTLQGKTVQNQLHQITELDALGISLQMLKKEEKKKKNLVFQQAMRNYTLA